MEVECLRVCVFVRVCVTLYLRQRPPTGGNAPVWPPTCIIFFLLSVLALSVHHTCLHFAPPIFFFYPQPSFHLLTCLHASVCPSVYHSVTVSNKLVRSPESLSSHSALITVSVSVIFSVCHGDRWSVCVLFCVCVYMTSVEPPWWFLVTGYMRVRSAWAQSMATEPSCLFIYYSKTKRTHINTHLLPVADKSKHNDQTLNKEWRTGNDRSPLPNLQTLGTMLCVCVCVWVVCVMVVGHYWLPHWDQRSNEAQVQTSIWYSCYCGSIPSSSGELWTGLDTTPASSVNVCLIYLHKEEDYLIQAPHLNQRAQIRCLMGRGEQESTGHLRCICKP